MGMCSLVLLLLLLSDTDMTAEKFGDSDLDHHVRDANCISPLVYSVSHRNYVYKAQVHVALRISHTVSRPYAARLWSSYFRPHEPLITHQTSCHLCWTYLAHKHVLPTPGDRSLSKAQSTTWRPVQQNECTCACSPLLVNFRRRKSPSFVLYNFWII